MGDYQIPNGDIIFQTPVQPNGVLPKDGNGVGVGEVGVKVQLHKDHLVVLFILKCVVVYIKKPKKETTLTVLAQATTYNYHRKAVRFLFVDESGVQRRQADIKGFQQLQLVGLLQTLEGGDVLAEVNYLLYVQPRQVEHLHKVVLPGGAHQLQRVLVAEDGHCTLHLSHLLLLIVEQVEGFQLFNEVLFGGSFLHDSS